MFLDIILNHNLPKQKSIASICRQHANNSFEGKRIDLVGFGEVLFCREILEVFKNMKATYGLAHKWDNVIQMMASRGVKLKPRYGTPVSPSRGPCPFSAGLRDNRLQFSLLESKL